MRTAAASKTPTNTNRKMYLPKKKDGRVGTMEVKGMLRAVVGEVGPRAGPRPAVGEVGKRGRGDINKGEAVFSVGVCGTDAMALRGIFVLVPEGEDDEPNNGVKTN